MDEQKIKMKKMANWTITVFATVFAITFAVLWLPIYPTSTGGLDTVWKIVAEGWKILLADLVLCILAYAVYSAYINHKK
jgi:hypothetical protein